MELSSDDMQLTIMNIDFMHMSPKRVISLWVFCNPYFVESGGFRRFFGLTCRFIRFII